jgi:hypothetical protein
MTVPVSSSPLYTLGLGTLGTHGTPSAKLPSVPVIRVSRERSGPVQGCKSYCVVCPLGPCLAYVRMGGMVGGYVQGSGP